MATKELRRTKQTACYGMFEDCRPAISMREAMDYLTTMAVVRRDDGTIETQYIVPGVGRAVLTEGNWGTKRFRLEDPKGVVLRHGLSPSLKVRRIVREFIMRGIVP